MLTRVLVIADTVVQKMKRAALNVKFAQQDTLREEQDANRRRQIAQVDTCIDERRAAIVRIHALYDCIELQNTARYRRECSVFAARASKLKDAIDKLTDDFGVVS